MSATLLYILIGILVAVAAAWVASLFIGFRAQKPEDYAGEGLVFDIRERLNGDMICEGVIYGPLGKVNARFVADLKAVWDGNEGVMTEKFRYDTGGSLDRKWNLRVVDGERIEATAADIIGTGEGMQKGSGVKLAYDIKLPDTAGGHVLSTTDWMYLMENGTIINRSQMRKFGIKVAELVATMRKAA